MEKPKFTAQQLEAILKGFTSKDVPKRSPDLPPTAFLLSEGCKFLLGQMGTHWLFRVIITYQQDHKVRNMNHQLWQVSHNKDDEWFIFLVDENDNMVVATKITGIDFPMKILFIIVHDGVVMLHNEFHP
ncbi:MAG TPA: hypothetical protein PK711_10145 [Bacteroidales bacterium]|nr:hypothetical protein [Bacteroidales bacterium]HRZ21321.1 hypothetical protein [Bacteroidales bacterium]